MSNKNGFPYGLDLGETNQTPRVFCKWFETRFHYIVLRIVPHLLISTSLFKFKICTSFGMSAFQPMIDYTWGELPLLWSLPEAIVDEIFAFIMHPYARMVLQRIADLNKTMPPEQRYVLSHRVMEMSDQTVLHNFDGATNHFIQVSMQDVEHIARMVTMIPLIFSFPHKTERMSCYAKHLWEELFDPLLFNLLRFNLGPFYGPTQKEFVKLIRPFKKDFWRKRSEFPVLTKDHRGIIIQSYDIHDVRYKFFDFPFKYLSREQAVLAFLVMDIPYTWNGQDRQGFWFHTQARKRIKHTQVVKFVEANRQLLV